MAVSMYDEFHGPCDDGWEVDGKPKDVNFSELRSDVGPQDNLVCLTISCRGEFLNLDKNTAAF